MRRVIRALRRVVSLSPVALSPVLFLLAGCASAGDPPGGPPDEETPKILATNPDSGAVLEQVPDEVVITFGEVISERTAATPPSIANAVILSPTLGETHVDWRRNRLVVKPKEGFQPERVYRVEVLPVITDLRQNRLADGRVVVFSTGPAIPAATLRGAVVDWPGARAAPRALIEAVLLPDSLPYRTLADSTGRFTMARMPAGDYLLFGIMDTNGDRRRGTREAFDSLRLTLADTAQIELYAFVHDTVGPRIRLVESQDSVTVKLTFDRPLDPTFTFDTALVTFATDEDTTARLPFAGIVTQAGLDSLRTAAEAARRPAAADTADTLAAAPAPAAPVVRPPGGRGPARGAPAESTLAQRMLARRPAPTDVRYLRLTQPLAFEVRYVIILDGVRGLTGVPNRSRGQIRLPRPPATRRPAAPDTTAPDSTPAPAASDTVLPDTTRPDSARRDASSPRHILTPSPRQ